MLQKTATPEVATPDAVRARSEKKLASLRARLAGLDVSRPALAFDADTGIESAAVELAENEAESGALRREIHQLETIAAEAARRGAAGRAARRKALVAELKATLREIEDTRQHAVEQAAFAMAALEEAEIKAGLATSHAFSLADALAGLTGDRHFDRSPQVLTKLNSEDALERFRTRFYALVRARRQAEGAPAWQTLVVEARALTVSTPTTGER